jgi:hypothetical protein
VLGEVALHAFKVIVDESVNAYGLYGPWLEAIYCEFAMLAGG